MKLLVAQSCPTLCDPMDCSLPGSSIHGILQARILEWVAIAFSKGSSQTQGSNLDLLHCKQSIVWATREAYFVDERARSWIPHCWDCKDGQCQRLIMHTELWSMDKILEESCYWLKSHPGCCSSQRTKLFCSSSSIFHKDPMYFQE